MLYLTECGHRLSANSMKFNQLFPLSAGLRYHTRCSNQLLLRHAMPLHFFSIFFYNTEVMHNRSTDHGCNNVYYVTWVPPIVTERFWLSSELYVRTFMFFGERKYCLSRAVGDFSNVRHFLPPGSHINVMLFKCCNLRRKAAFKFFLAL